MFSLEKTIGSNIKEVRKERGLSQETLAHACGFSNTTLSSYETGRKSPSLFTIAKIAKQLKVPIERLYYGDENKAFIASEPDVGRRIVNAVYYLWSEGVISYYEKIFSGMDIDEYSRAKEPRGVFFKLEKYSFAIKRLLSSLNEFERKKDTYPDPDKYLDFLLSSVATEIDKER